MLYLDTSVLVPLFVPEPDSDSIRRWFDRQTEQALAISDWTLTEFASAMGIKVREKNLKPALARKACELMNALAAESLQVFTPTRADHVSASRFLDQHALGLRAGDALHLGVASNQGATAFHTLDRRLLDAGGKLGIKTQSPV